MKYDMSQRKDEISSAPSSVKQILEEFQSKLDDDNRFRKPPVIRRAPPPPPPPHQKPPTPSSTCSTPSFSNLTHSSDPLRRSLGPKPKVAPKPLFLNRSIPSSSNLPDSDKIHPEVQTPIILVSPAADKTVDFSNGFAEESTFENGNGVKDMAKQLENLGFVPRANSRALSRTERPLSLVSTLSQVSDDFDDGDTSASEDESTTDEKRLRRHRHEDDFIEELPLPRTARKTTMTTTTHTEIMHEMEHLFIKNGNKKKPQRRQSDSNDIPADIGKLRDNRKGRHNSLFVSPTSAMSNSFSDDFSRITSMTSDRSSIMTSNSGGGDSTDGIIIPDYQTGDEEEDKRLKKLHYAAVEFQKVQTNYVHYLNEMAVLYPEYMERFGKRVGRDLLAPQNGHHENVVLQIKKILVQILPLHEMLLKEIDSVCTNWDSRTPNMSKIIGTYAEFLKCCQPFLDKKAEFLSKLLQLRNEDKEFDEATFMFETEVFKRGKKGAVIQQLDQVHQNFMRYKLLMLRYSEYLEEGSEEKLAAEAAIEKLEKMTQAINQKMGLPTTEELTNLHYRFQCQFNVLEPGRVLIRQGDVKKQTRKEEQPRYLVLFTDCLWVCRVSSSRTHGQFEMHRSYRIPLEYMRFDRMEDDEHLRCLMVKSKVKSAVFIFATEKERDQWADDLTKAQFDRKSYKRRQSTAAQRHDENKLKMKKLMLLAERNIEEDDEERPKSLTGRSRSTSFSQDEMSSVPVTPGDVDIVPDFGDVETPVKNGTKKQASDVVKPVWLPDNISNECLMEGCSTEFNLINRRHHCRDCGWLICKDCKGQAPLSKYEFLKQNVCSECFVKINELYKSGTLFPGKYLVTMSDGSYGVRIGKKHEQEIVDPRKLFKYPQNVNFKHRNIDEKRAGSVVFGKVYLRSRKSEVVRHALLRREDLKLVMYKAELDSKSVLEVLIYGYFYRETCLDSGGWLFELVHRNQIRTDDTKDDVIAFRVDNSTSAKKWSAAFADKLELDPTQVQIADC